jgi:hypothetical protein
MKKIIIFLCLSVLFASCSTSTKKQRAIQPYAKKTIPYNKTPIVYKQSKVKNNGELALMTAQNMVEEGEIVRGSCWDYLDVAYTRAGFNRKNRQIVFKSNKKGPFASINIIKPGDWLYFINHSYRNNEHSGMFVSWINKDKKIANILSYPGERRKQPGRYRNYNLKSVYHIMRPKNKI